MLLSMAIPYPKDQTETPFYKLFGGIGPYQRKYSNDTIQYRVYDYRMDSFVTNSDPNKMVLQIPSFSSYEVSSPDTLTVCQYCEVSSI